MWMLLEPRPVRMVSLPDEPKFPTGQRYPRRSIPDATPLKYSLRGVK
jgi:hypothetical protein